MNLCVCDKLIKPCLFEVIIQSLTNINVLQNNGDKNGSVQELKPKVLNGKFQLNASEAEL